MATTAAAIRDAMFTLVKAIVPDIHAGQRFDPFRDEMDFRESVEKSPSSCLRRISIQFTGDREAPAVTNTRVEEVSETVEILVAYPNDARHGAYKNRGIHDVIASDIRQLHHALHVANSPAGATVIRTPDSRETVGSPVVAVLAVVRYRVDYYWSLV